MSNEFSQLRKPLIYGKDSHAGRNLELFPSPDHAKNKVEYASIQSAIRFYSTNIFAIGPNISRMYFKEFFLLYWTGDWIIQSSKDKQGFISRNGKSYEIIYKYPTTRRMILRGIDRQFALSFREPFAEYNLPNVVIISAGRGTKE